MSAKKEMKQITWKNLWGSGDTAIIETIDLCFPRYDQLQRNNDISVLFWPIHTEGNLFCVTGGLQGTPQLMCARDQGQESPQLESQRRESGKVVHSLCLVYDVNSKVFLLNIYPLWWSSSLLTVNNRKHQGFRWQSTHTICIKYGYIPLKTLLHAVLIRIIIVRLYWECSNCP